MLPENKITAPEKTERPRLKRKVPETWSPKELETMLGNVSSEFLPWLSIGAFLGLRTSEILRLDWSDFRWDDFAVLIVRPEITKTGERRIVPIPDNLKLWLPSPPSSGPVCAKKPNARNRKKEAETTRVGKHVGGWRHNALRHSWISYRVAQVGAAKAALEAGNSEAMTRRNYNDAKTAKEAEEWFAVGSIANTKLTNSR